MMFDDDGNDDDDDDDDDVMNMMMMMMLYDDEDVLYSLQVEVGSFACQRGRASCPSGKSGPVLT